MGSGRRSSHVGARARARRRMTRWRGRRERAFLGSPSAMASTSKRKSGVAVISREGKRFVIVRNGNNDRERAGRRPG